ncbi:MAG: radical SAM protein [Fibromonadaceae bacterium]|nr:radical SAM protein [Fibromonadaceae bacterium]
MIVREISSKNILIKSKLAEADYVINAYTGCPYKCVYCYAEFMKKFTSHNEDWGEFIDIKMFDRVIIPRDIEGKYIFASSVTDPYNNYEIEYEKTKQALIELKKINCHIEILTKSENVLRDLELFKQFKSLEVGISLSTLDDDFRKLIEPRASSVEDRIDLLKILKENNIKNRLFISPMFPYLSDYRKIIEQTRDFTDFYVFENLNLRAENKYNVLNIIKQNYCNLHKDYMDIYKYNSSHTYWNELEEEIIKYCKSNGIKYRMHFFHNYSY